MVWTCPALSGGTADGQYHNPKLYEDVKTQLRVRAAEHHRSMEEEARIILRDAVNGGRTDPRDLAKFTRECFAPLGGVELELPSRGPMREPPDFSREAN